MKLKTSKLWLGLTTLCTVVLVKSPAQAAPPPNIVVILADDMEWSNLGCYGSEIATPNIDRLAANGVRFTEFYNTARCSPSRACLMTGLYPHEAGMGYLDDLVTQDSKGITGRLNDHAVTIAQAQNPKIPKATTRP